MITTFFGHITKKIGESSTTLEYKERFKDNVGSRTKNEVFMSSSAIAGGAAPMLVDGHLAYHTVVTFHEGPPPAGPSFQNNATSLSMHTYQPVQMPRGGELAEYYDALKLQWTISASAHHACLAAHRAAAVATDALGGKDQGSQTARAADSAPVALVANAQFNPHQQYFINGNELQRLVRDATSWRDHQRSTAAAADSNSSKPSK